VNTAIKEMTEKLRTMFGYSLSADGGRIRDTELLEKQIIADLEKDLDDKEALIGAEYINMIIRENYLHSVDRKWLDHLENMEALREAVYLRHYEQKNPLTEYKVEGYRIFETMIEEIRQEIASRLHLIRIQTADGGQRRPVSRSVGAVQSASHSSMGAFDSLGANSAASPASSTASRSINAASRPDGATVVRGQPKVGRNDPCPCGSGKKYKMCHGR
jgi:preprotein translocase subunit SecA